MKYAVFGYGSVVSRKDLEITLGRMPDKIIPATLKGWKRSWSVVVSNSEIYPRFENVETGELPGSVIALNIEPSVPGDLTNGILVGMTMDEIEIMDLRELHYHRVEVTDSIAADHNYKAIFTYTGKPEFTNRNMPGSVIPSSYKEVVEAGFNEISPESLAQFHKTTEVSHYPITDTVYVRSSRNKLK